MQQYNIMINVCQKQTVLPKVCLVWLFILLSALLPSLAIADKQVILASIKPLELIAAAVAGDAFETRTLLPSSRSPHDYALKFSDRQAMLDAHLILWVGPDLESPLSKLLTGSNGRQANVLQVGDVVELSCPMAAEESHQTNHDGHDHGHEHGDCDPHVWLNPENAVRIAGVLRDRLIAIKPEKSDDIQKNYENFSMNVAKMVNATRRQLGPVTGVGFVVVHDGYLQWIDFYQLRQLAAIRLASGAERGLKHRAKLISLRGEVACVFSEPQWPQAWAEGLAKQLDARVGILDPMGQEVPVSENGYVELMTALADNLVRCLSAQTSNESNGQLGKSR